MNLSSINFLTK